VQSNCFGFVNQPDEDIGENRVSNVVGIAGFSKRSFFNERSILSAFPSWGSRSDAGFKKELKIARGLFASPSASFF